MSLFKLKTLWTKSFPQEEFDERHIAVGKIDNKACLALANFNGILRMFLVDSSSKMLSVSPIY